MPDASPAFVRFKIRLRSNSFNKPINRHLERLPAFAVDGFH